MTYRGMQYARGSPQGLLETTRTKATFRANKGAADPDSVDPTDTIDGTDPTGAEKSIVHA